MKIFRIVLLVVLGLSIATYIGTLVALNYYTPKSKLIQRIEKNEGSELFGESGTPIGSPQRLIIEDPKAFTGKKTASGAEEVDEKYLKEHNIYPLQLQSVRYVSLQAQNAATFGILLSAAGLLWLRFRKPKTIP